MTPQQLIEALGPAALPVGLAAVAGLVVALGAAGGWGAGRRLPAGVAAAAVGLPALVLWAALPTARGVDALAAHAAMRLVAPVVLGAPAATLLLFTGLFGALRGPRRVVAPILGVGLAIAIGATVWASGVAIDEGVFAPARGVAYAIVGGFAAIGLMAGDRERGVGAECAATAGVAFAALVVAGEGAGFAMPEVVMALNLHQVAVEHRATFIDAFLADAVTRAVPWAWGAVAGAAAFVGVGIAAGPAEPRRIGLAALAGLWLAPGIATLARSPATAAWVEAAKTLPAPVVTPAATPGTLPERVDPVTEGRAGATHR